MNPILIEESYWRNSQLSVAKYYGGVHFNGQEYLIVNKEGITLEELSNPQSENYVGKGQYAIPTGEPADLVLKTWLPVYRHFGREGIIGLLRERVSLEKALMLIK